MVLYQPSPSTPSVKIMPPSDVEKRKFKQRKHPPTKLKDFTNVSGKKLKVNDAYEVDPLCPIDPEQLKDFHKWLDGKVKNKNYIDLKTCDAKVEFFQWVWSDGKGFSSEVRTAYSLLIDYFNNLLLFDTQLIIIDILPLGLNYEC